MSLPRMIARVCAALAILLGLIVLGGWTLHVPATQPGAAVSLVLSGLALAGIVARRRRLTLACSAITAIFSTVSLLEYLFGRSRLLPASALCFLVLATGFVLAQVGPPAKRSAMLGIAGLLAAAVGAAGGIAVIFGGGDALGLGIFTGMAVQTAGGLLLLGIGAVAVALELSQGDLRQPIWAAVGSGIFLVTIRIALLQAFSPKNQTGMSSTLALLGALFGAVVFGVFVHLALRANLQRALLGTVNRRLEQETLQRRRAEETTLALNEQLERRVEERTKALEAVNQEFRNEIARRELVEEDLRRQKEILQTVFDHIPVMVGFVDQNGQPQLVNREWERTLGWSLAEIRSQNIDVIAQNYPGLEDRNRVRDFLVRANGEWADFKTKVRDGRVIDTTWAMRQLSDGTGIGIGQDISARKQAEEDLRRQKEILQTIFDHLPVMINFGDGNYRIQLANREWEKTLGWSVEEIRRGNVDILAENYPDPQYREKVLDFVTNSHGEWADFKTTVRDGRVIDTCWAMLHLPDGTSIGIGQDITERKRAEEALRESEERFRQLAENIDDLFWIKTPDFKHALYLSPIYKSLTGRSPEERYGDPDSQQFLNMIHPEDREPMAEIIQRASGEAFDLEFRITQADGSVRWIRDRGFPIRDQSGQVYRIAGIATDITGRKLAEETLRESEERFRQLAENIHEVFWLRSLDLKQLLYVSPMFEKVCGQSRESLYADGPELLVHPEDRPRVIQTLKDLAGREFEIEYRIVTKEGDVRWIRDRGFPIRDGSGAVCRMGGVAEDITDRKEADDRLKASSGQLRALSAKLQSAREEEAKRIARQIHDELGGLLTGLRWELEALEKMIQQPGDVGQLQAMRDKFTSMRGLADTTINVVRWIASELRPSILDDLGLVEAIEWQTQQFQARTGIHCRSDCALQSIPLGDQQSTAVFRIFQEALTNVLRHAQATCVGVAMKEENGLFILTVTDNGRGITPAEKLGRTSLGLLGMQERAHLIGGRVDIIGAKGTGTTLHVCIPLAGRAAGLKT